MAKLKMKKKRKKKKKQTLIKIEFTLSSYWLSSYPANQCTIYFDNYVASKSTCYYATVCINCGILW